MKSNNYDNVDIAKAKVPSFLLSKYKKFLERKGAFSLLQVILPPCMGLNDELALRSYAEQSVEVLPLYIFKIRFLEPLRTNKVPRICWT